MKFALMMVVFVVAGYFAFMQLKPKPAPPPPPPPPPPPAILSEPLPVINEAEQAKIIKTTEDPDPNVRWEALVLLDKMKSPTAYPILFAHLQKDLDAGTRVKIASLLSHRKGPEITRNLEQALKDQEPDVRLAVLVALDDIGDYSAASSITECLKDQEESVRVQALKTLNSLQDKRTAEIEAERKHQEELQRQAAEAAAAAAQKK